MFFDDETPSSLISRSKTEESFDKLQTYFKASFFSNNSKLLFNLMMIYIFVLMLSRDAVTPRVGHLFRAPDQVLRYKRLAHAKTLWPMSSGRPSKLDIRKFNYCGDSRTFGFQVTYLH